MTTIRTKVVRDLLKDGEATRCMFRIDKYGDFKGDVTAVLFDEPANIGQFTCYASVGQHGDCTRMWYIQKTRAGKPEEYAKLKVELENVGYKNIHVYQRMPSDFRAWSERGLAV